MNFTPQRCLLCCITLVLLCITSINANGITARDTNHPAKELIIVNYTQLATMDMQGLVHYVQQLYKQMDHAAIVTIKNYGSSDNKDDFNLMIHSLTDQLESMGIAEKNIRVRQMTVTTENHYFTIGLTSSKQVQ